MTVLRSTAATIPELGPLLGKLVAAPGDHLPLRAGLEEVRLEWYPRMDVLIEIEGDQPGIEAALCATGLPRTGFSADPLAVFAERFASRTGTPAALATSELAGESPSWQSR